MAKKESELPDGVLFRRGSYYARVTYVDERTGKKRDIQQVAKNITHAKQLRDDLRRELADHGAEHFELRRKSFREFADWFKTTYIRDAEYVGDVKVRGTLRSARTVELHWRTIVAHFGKRPVHSIRYGDLLAFRNARLRAPVHVTRGKHEGDDERAPRQRSIASVNREIALLRRMFRIARREGWVTRNPFDEGDSLISIADERKRERILSLEEEQRLLAACDAHPKASVMRPLLIAALETGCRQGELLKLVWSDVDMTGRRIRIQAFNTKVMRERMVPIPPRLATELRALRGDRIVAADALVFGIVDNVKNSWTTIRRKAGLEGLRFHDLRHTSASRLARKLSLSDVGKILGHSDPKTTWRYVNADQSLLDRAAAVHEELHK